MPGVEGDVGVSRSLLPLPRRARRGTRPGRGGPRAERSGQGAGGADRAGARTRSSPTRPNRLGPTIPHRGTGGSPTPRHHEEALVGGRPSGSDLEMERRI